MYCYTITTRVWNTKEIGGIKGRCIFACLLYTAGSNIWSADKHACVHTQTHFKRFKIRALFQNYIHQVNNFPNNIYFSQAAFLKSMFSLFVINSLCTNTNLQSSILLLSRITVFLQILYNFLLSSLQLTFY